MVKAVETRIYRLHHDPQTSERIGYLASQQRLAYNIAAGILNRTPTIALRRSPRHPDGLLGQLTLWRHQDSRAQAPYIIHQAGAQHAWMANDLMKRERNSRLQRLDNGLTRSSDHRQHRRTLARRSRKRGTSTLTSLTSPVRLDDSTFTIMGARDIVLRTKKPVPEAIRPADEILGVDDGVKRQLTLSNGDVLHHDDGDNIIRQRRMRDGLALHAIRLSSLFKRGVVERGAMAQRLVEPRVVPALDVRLVLICQVTLFRHDSHCRVY